MAAPLYKRYVPPKKPVLEAVAQETSSKKRVPSEGETNGNSKRRRLSSNDIPPSNGVADRSSPESSKKNHANGEVAVRIKQTGSRTNNLNSDAGKSQPKKNDIRETSKKPEVLSSTDGTSAIALQNSDEAAVDSEARRSKRKRRKKNKKQVTEELDDPEVDDQSPMTTGTTKHTSVMSKFEKAIKNQEMSKQLKATETAPTHEDDKLELQDLVPIPRPKKPQVQENSTQISTLPNWIGEPVYVSDAVTSTFESLGVDHYFIQKLAKKSVSEPLPIQTGLLPLLLPSFSQHNGDVCAAAVTGSGKTLAYTLPIVQSLKDRADRRIRALVVVPTRELVTQVQEAFELISAGTSLCVGTATGSTRLKLEQATLLKEVMTFDPNKYNELLGDDSEELLGEKPAFDQLDPSLPYHVREFKPNIDILVCTPGRLVEHIKLTPGFSLHSLEWLIIDEADRLLDQRFQEWADVLVKAMERSPFDNIVDWQHSIYPTTAMGLFHPVRPRLMKVVLSATMTSDLDKLDSLRLNNPKLVMLSDSLRDLDNGQAGKSLGTLEVPKNLIEHAVPVDDAAEKPLVLLALLAKILPGLITKPTDSSNDTSNLQSDGSISDSSSVSDTDSDSDSSSSDESSVSSSSGSSSTSDSGTTQSSISEVGQSPAMAQTTPNRKITSPSTPILSNVLIFVNSLESAQRLRSLLTHLLGRLQKSELQKSTIMTLTKVNSKSATNKLLRAFERGSVRILIATDRASRGLDLPNLSNVVNYDIPNKLTSYVHRIGRTARVGRHGDAWTLVEHREARWFWKEIGKRNNAGEQNLETKNMVDRVRLDVASLGDGIRGQYADALKHLQKEVHGAS